MKPALQIYLMSRTYNSYGGHPALSLVSELMMAEMPYFGPAVSELTLTFHFLTSGPPTRSLEQLYATFHRERLKLPKVIFRRSREKVSIDVASNLIDRDDEEFPRRISLALLKASFAEILTALDLLLPRFKETDAFALDKFLEYCRRLQSSLPNTDEDLALLTARLDERKNARRSAISPWDRLGIDWRDFHPDARRILDDPFYWEEANDFSPHGNDTGADLLSDYRKWSTNHPSGDPLAFLRELVASWSFRDDSTDPMFRAISDEAVVALAFAELKIRGVCHPAVADLAKQAAKRQREEALRVADGPIRQDRLKSLELIEAKL
jgi:uncharacterized protein YfeS